MFADLDETLRQLLVKYVPLDPSEIEISFDTPDREWSGRLSRPAVNLFLYDVRENHKLRAASWEVRRDGPNKSATRLKGPIRIQASYQVTTWARVREDEHRLLWRVLAALMRHPILPADLLVGGMKDQPIAIPTQVGQPEHMPGNAGDLWGALDNRIRPALTYVVTLALDPELVITSPLVLTSPQFRVRQTDGPVTVAGRVRDREDPTRPIPGALVLLSETGDRAMTDEDGRFRFGGVPHGPVTIVVRAAGRADASLSTKAPSSSYDLEV